MVGWVWGLNLERLGSQWTTASVNVGKSCQLTASVLRGSSLCACHCIDLANDENQGKRRLILQSSGSHDSPPNFGYYFFCDLR